MTPRHRKVRLPESPSVIIGSGIAVAVLIIGMTVLFILLQSPVVHHVTRTGGS
jgi:hypothetical protein